MTHTSTAETNSPAPPCDRAGSTTALHVGGFDVEVEHARTLIDQYVHPADGIVTGFGHYDHLATGAPATGPLIDADLLAPNLLNAPVDLKRFAALQDLRDEMQAALDPIPAHADLAEADDETIELLGPLFAVLDSLAASRRGIGPVIYSKVLHRKRPGLVPIIDTNVMWCYCHDHERHAPVPIQRGRNWADFTLALAYAMRTDLQHAPASWTELAAVASPSMTRLRALDIVAWRTGNHPRRADDVRS